MSTRRNFLLQTALGMAATTMGPLTATAAVSGRRDKATLPMGMAGYTFAKFNLDQAIAIMNRVNIKNISVKDIHLPLNSSEEKIKEVLGKFSAAGINVYAVGVIYMKTKQAVDEAFEYAKRVGVPLIVGVPTPDLLDYTEEKIKAYNIRLAVHNHGPEDALYPGPKNAYDLIKNRDPRLGLCLDIGHATRAGEAPDKAVLAYKNRIFDLHIKDVSAAAKDGKAIELGRGVIDFKKLVGALDKINYQGVCSIEYEKDMSDPLPGIAESAGYFRGVIHTLNS
ncbi:sugar phosphate isomerase/epimerase [Chitinophaga polysaccharea]|uniref:sugar phosphate isomerase/epimerase family protein n=1 Tax=Chitinophaga polysaccharea TaxID=1293035 RepID=UPI00145550FC|nr:sugar phosphate isomerase/epimerase [Chitinophaga polysaccharea]NLR57346.1 sugar phosphate isomerase/epimerase [Chitinophaga polysaccharea]